MDLKIPKAKQPLPRDAKLVFKGVIFDVYQWRQKMFDGSYEIFEKIKRPDSVMVIPITTAGKIILTIQKQPGKESFIGAVGGRADPGEKVVNCAKRELLEETGYKANKFSVFDVHHASGKIDWVVYTLIAKGCKKVRDMNPDNGEKISLKYVSFKKFLQIIWSPEFQDSEIPNKLIKEGFVRMVWNKEKVNELKKQFLA